MLRLFDPKENMIVITLSHRNPDDETDYNELFKSEPCCSKADFESAYNSILNLIDKIISTNMKFDFSISMKGKLNGKVYYEIFFDPVDFYSELKTKIGELQKWPCYYEVIKDLKMLGIINASDDKKSQDTEMMIRKRLYNSPDTSILLVTVRQLECDIHQLNRYTILEHDSYKQNVVRFLKDKFPDLPAFYLRPPAPKNNNDVDEMDFNI